MKLITLPRIVGIVLIAIALFTHYARQGAIQALLLGIASLVLLLTPRKPAEKYWKQFLASLKPTKVFGILLLIDALFWTLLAILTVALTVVLRDVVTQVKSVAPTKDIAMNVIGTYNDVLGAAFTKGIIALVVFWVALTAAYALSRGMIWLTLHGKKFEMRFFLRFFALNLAWCTLWVAATLFLMSALMQPYGGISFLVLLPLYAHLTTILHSTYAQTRNARRSVGAAFSYGLGRLGSWANPYCYLLIGYVVLSQIMRALPPGKLALGVTFILFFLFMAWYRVFLKNTLRSLQ
jgi:hypothetical protein